MRLAVFSHKEVWRDPARPGGFATVGGFPAQMRAIAELFDGTTIVCCLRQGRPPLGAKPLEGPRMSVEPLPEPPGLGWRRKALFPFWLLVNAGRIGAAVRRADAVHAVLLGDVGTVGLVAALLLGKPLFARHCGMWTYDKTIAARLTKRLLVAAAGGRKVVMATGGGDAPPEPSKRTIQWIFSTSLSERSLAELPTANPWEPGKPLRLITVGRLSPAKNVEACIEALPVVREAVPGAELHIVGTGTEAGRLERLARLYDAAGSVVFHGNVAHKRALELLAQSHIFVFPSLGEGFPKAVLEAMAAGLVVVASPVSVLPHLLGDGAGMVLREATGRALGNAILAVVHDPAAMARLGRTARERAAAYTFERWGEEIRTRLEAAWKRPLREQIAASAQEETACA